MTRRLSAKQWSDHVSRHAASKRPLAAYCRQHGLAIPTFRHWRNKLKAEPAVANPPTKLPTLVPLSRLIDYAGYIQVDAFPSYDRLFDTPSTGRKAIEVACWAHARRKFIEVAALTGKGRTHDALRYINRLFRIERKIRHINDADRRTERMSRALPVLNALKAWLDREVNAVLPRSALGTAVIYTLKNWDALCRYTEEGYLEMDNNTAERCMRPIALGRKNFMFFGSERAGHAAAIWYTLTESCKLSKVNPLTYITYLLENVRKREGVRLRPDQFGRAVDDLNAAA